MWHTDQIFRLKELNVFGADVNGFIEAKWKDGKL